MSQTKTSFTIEISTGHPYYLWILKHPILCKHSLKLFFELCLQNIDEFKGSSVLRSSSSELRLVAQACGFLYSWPPNPSHFKTCPFTLTVPQHVFQSCLQTHHERASACERCLVVITISHAGDRRAGCTALIKLWKASVCRQPASKRLLEGGGGGVMLLPVHKVR